MLLWIRRVFSTRSAVYGQLNWRDKACISPARMLEKKRLVANCRLFAHRVLWICSGLSTAAIASCRFCQQNRARPCREPERPPVSASSIPCQTIEHSVSHDSRQGRQRSRAVFELQVLHLFNKRDIYKTGSSSKRPPELWIRPIFSTSSRVYVIFYVLNKPCIWLARNAYRFGGPAKGARFAHSFLWIYMTLSTVRIQQQPLAAHRPAWRSTACRQSRDRQAKRSWPVRFEASAQGFEANKKKIFRRASHAASQVYKLSMYTRLVVVLTTGTFCG